MLQNQGAVAGGAAEGRSTWKLDLWTPVAVAALIGKAAKIMKHWADPFSTFRLKS